MKRTIVSLAALTVMFSGVAVGVANAQPDTAACSEAIGKVSLAVGVKADADLVLKTKQDAVVVAQKAVDVAQAAYDALPTEPAAAKAAALAILDAAKATRNTAVAAITEALIKAAANAKIALDLAVAEKNTACKTPPTTTPTVTTTVTPPPVIVTPRPIVSSGVDTGGE